MNQTARLSGTQRVPESGALSLQRKCACGAEASALTNQCEKCGKAQMLGLQTKLTVSEPGDRYEQEADRVAEEVMRMPEPDVQRHVAPEDDEEDESLQLKTLESGASVQRQAAEEDDDDEEEEEQIQAKERPGATPVVTSTVSSRINAMRGTGAPLAESVRAYFEPRFGVDFSKTRIHTGARAVDTARAVKARAFTRGRDMYFNAGEFQPATASGKRLLANEFAHAVEQVQGDLGTAPSSSDHRETSAEPTSSCGATHRLAPQGATTSSGPGQATQRSDTTFAARFSRLRTGCIKDGSLKVSTSIGLNTATAATGLLTVQFEGDGRTKLNPGKLGRERLFRRGKIQRADNGKFCFCDCMRYRQYIAGKAWEGLPGGTANTPLKNTIASGNTTLPADGVLREENTLGPVWCNAAGQTGCDRCFRDNPGVPPRSINPLSPSKPISLRYNFVLQIWDACQQRELWAEKHSLTISGSNAPRSIAWSTAHQSLTLASINGAASVKKSGGTK